MIRVFSRYVSAKSLLLMLVEGMVIALSLLVAAKLRFWNNSEDLAQYVSFPDFLVQSAIVVIACIACFYYNDLYDLSVANSTDRVLRLEQSLGAATLLLGLLYFLAPSLLLSRGVFIIGMILATASVAGSRELLDKVWHLTAPAQRVVILGTGPLAVDLARELTKRGDLSLKLDGFLAAAGETDPSEQVFGFPVLGTVSELERITERHRISRIIVALDDRRGVLPTRELVTLRVQGIHVEEAQSALSALTGKISLRRQTPSWFVFSAGFRRSRWNELLKRTLDLAFGVVGLICSLPVMAVVALAVRLDSAGPVIYRQTRVGRRGKHFQVLKFRSMRVDAEKGTGAQWASENDPRATRVGRILRKYRLDELPQFINVIRGDMSFVGPRPERPSFVEALRKTIPYYDERHSVRPGITGWAQVEYFYGSNIEDAFNKLEYDFFYLKNMSVLFDLAIIFKTVRIVLRGDGA